MMAVLLCESHMSDLHIREAVSSASVYRIVSFIYFLDDLCLVSRN